MYRSSWLRVEGLAKGNDPVQLINEANVALLELSQHI